MKKGNPTTAVASSQNLFPTATTSNWIAEQQPFFLTNMDIVKKAERIKPNQADSLFWCYYILKHGRSAYEQQVPCGGSIGFVKEKQQKITLVEQLRNPLFRNKLKQSKLCSIEHLEDQLANQATIDLATFFTLCYLFDLPVLYFQNHCYYHSLPEALPWLCQITDAEETTASAAASAAASTSATAEGPRDREGGGGLGGEPFYDPHGTGYDDGEDFDFLSVFVLRQTNGAYWIQPTNVFDIDWNRWHRIENVKKPLKAISAYTAGQLKQMAKKVGIEVAGKNKQEIYDCVKLFFKIDII